MFRTRFQRRNIMKMAALWCGICFLCLGQILSAPPDPRNKAVFVEKKDEFMDQLKERAAKRDEKKEEKEMEIKMDFSGFPVPSSPSEFAQAWHQPPLSQDLTGSCWAFSSVSFFECEVYRLSQRKIKLSEMFTVYWECVEKAHQYVRERGESNFGRGSQPNATVRIWKKYGIIPVDAYGRIDPEKDLYDDNKMFAEMKACLESVKEKNEWNEDLVLSNIRAILDRYMGPPPQKITIEGKDMTPQEYLKNVLKLNLDDYVDLMSLMKEPFYRKVEYKVWDNWWHSRDYYNVPLEDFMSVIKKAVRWGYTLCIAGDNSEPGFYPPLNSAVIPSFDIPSSFIDDNARQFRFLSESTTDDHAIHLVGYLEKDGKDWYLIKDSGSKCRNGKHKGYMFYHEDFVKLKMMNIMLHKDAAKEALEKCQ